MRSSHGQSSTRPRSPLASLSPRFLLLVALASSTLVTAVTVYTGVPTATASGSQYTGLAAYDPTTLTPPTPPSPPTTSYTLTLPLNQAGVESQGLWLSREQKGNFLGFSIELSVENTVLGTGGTQLKPQLLNYLANIKTRAGAGPILRVGGNTQDSSTLFVDGLANGSVIEKIKSGSDRYGNAITTPVINYSLDVFYTMSNISSLVGAQWYFGLAFNQSDVTDLDINPTLVTQYAQQVLGDSLLGLVVGNEPDLYVDHNHRESGWNVTNYIEEYNAVTQQIIDNGVLDKQAIFVGPSLCCQVENFQLQDVFNQGYLSDDNSPHITMVSVQHYPTNNCQLSGVINAQDIFYEFLNHTSAQALTSLYTNDVATTLAAGKEIMMMEMNTASCGGFAGLSDSFGAAMWMTDWALQMAYANFSAALMHVGGQNVYYNPFTPPPSTYSSTVEWTTGSVYFSTLVVAETFGQSNASRIVDLNADSGNIYHPAYAVYENDTPTRAVLFNFVTDTSGASDISVTLNLDSSSLADTVYVRYLRASSTADKTENITWAGMNMGGSFGSDGRLYGDEDTTTINCTAGACVIPVPAPSIALVFLSQTALSQSSVAEDATSTYPTTVIGTGSATVDPAVLATSNGEAGDSSGSTSKGKKKNAASRRARVFDLASGFTGPILATAFALGGAYWVF